MQIKKNTQLALESEFTLLFMYSMFKATLKHLFFVVYLCICKRKHFQMRSASSPWPRLRGMCSALSGGRRRCARDALMDYLLVNCKLIFRPTQRPWDLASRSICNILICARPSALQGPPAAALGRARVAQATAVKDLCPCNAGVQEMLWEAPV